MIPKATKSYAMEDPAPGEGPAAGGEALRIYIYRERDRERETTF